MKLLKNNRIYVVLKSPDVSLSELKERMEKLRTRELGSAQGTAVGWTPPAGKSSDVLVIEVQAQRLMTVMTQRRILPSSVIKDALATRQEALEQKQGAKLTKAERLALKEDVMADLMPQAFIRKTSTNVWWDTRRQRIIVDASSAKAAEATLDLLRETLGSLSIRPLTTRQLPARTMTEWLRNPASRPDWLTLGEDARLKMPGDGTTFTVKNGDLAGDEVEAALNNGSLVEKIMLNCSGQAAFELDDSLGLKKIKLDDRVLEEANQIQEEDPVSRLQTDFIIMADSLSQLYTLLIESLGGMTDAASNAEAA